MDNLIENLFKQYKTFFGNDEPNVYFAPGRVNLIGDHTDYTGGLVLPFAIDRGTYILAVANDSCECRIVSLNFEQTVTNVSMIDYEEKAGHWSDYLRGIISEFAKIGITFSTGIDALVYGNIPNGSGLSSSASLEMALILALTDCNGIAIPKVGSSEMIRYTRLAQSCENNFIGVNCGIMDQFIIANAKKNSAIMLNSYNLDFDYIPLDLPYKILVMNTNHKRRLGQSKYNERRSQCEIGFAELQKLGCTHQCLGQLSFDEWQHYSQAIKEFDETIYKRINHVVTENARVNEVCNALKSGKFNEVVDLINQSGDSLRTDYEVTGENLDAIVESAKQTDGVLAARMTGGGFGGCAIGLVECDKLDNVIKSVGADYEKQTNVEATFYQFESSDGAKKL